MNPTDHYCLKGAKGRKSQTARLGAVLSLWPLSLGFEISTPLGLVAPPTRRAGQVGERLAAGCEYLVGSAMQPETASAGECPSLIYPLPSIIERIDLGKLFPGDAPLEVELGSGDSSFLVEYARRHAGHNFIGVERLLGRIRKLDRKGRRAGLTNLRGVQIESSYFLQYLLPPHSASALHVYFPDP